MSPFLGVHNCKKNLCVMTLVGVPNLHYLGVAHFLSHSSHCTLVCSVRMCRRISHLFTKSWEQNEHVYLLDSLFIVAFLVFTFGADFFLGDDFLSSTSGLKSSSLSSSPSSASTTKSSLSRSFIKEN